MVEQLIDLGRRMVYVYSNEQLVELKSTKQIVYILGTSYYYFTDNDKLVVNDKIHRHLKSTLYIGYKQGFKMKDNSEKQISSDRGWGCMLRTGQMMLAEAFKKIIAYEEYPSINQQQTKQIIDMFQDHPDSVFSIQNICNVGSKNYQIKYQQWLTPCQISYILQDLFYAHQNTVIQTIQKPFEILIFRDSIIFQQELEQCFMKNYNKEENYLFEDVKEMKNQNEIEEKAILVLLMCQLGINNSIEHQYMKQVNQLMELSQFNGILGGQSSKAYFLIGKKDTDVYFLDPHYTQTYNKDNYQSYTQNKIFKQKISQIQSSLCFSFLIKGFQDSQRFIKSIQKIVDCNGYQGFCSFKDQKIHYSFKDVDLNNLTQPKDGNRSWEILD